MLISSNFASQTRWSIFTLGPQMHQAAPAYISMLIPLLFQQEANSDFHLFIYSWNFFQECIIWIAKMENIRYLVSISCVCNN